MIRPIKFFFVIFLLVTAFMAHAQSTTTAMPSTQFDTSGLPLWVRDLRRAEIVAFGSFPFTMLFATTAVDTYRFFNNNMDSRYAPLFKSAGAVAMTEQEQIITITSAVAVSLLISLADFLIVQYKRYKQTRRNNNLPEGTPIIIRKPVQEQPGEQPSESGTP